MKYTLTSSLSILIFSLFLFSPPHLMGQKKKAEEPTPTAVDPLDGISLGGLKFRSVGPAFTSGRISDIAVHPDDHATWYVATAAGGVWKTDNAGTTFTPIFDQHGSYSIGCVAIDPGNPNVIWVGTGENNNQRSVAYGDGIYKSTDGGKTFSHMGLEQSEHIGKIIVHPDNSEIVYVAAIGPLWSSGGDRGVYKTTNGGKTWDRILHISEHTGVNDLIMDSQNPDVLFAAAFQRRRHVFTYLGGGPESGLHVSRDGGTTWQPVSNGLPKADMGRIGLAQSPANPDVIYATVEAALGKSGCYVSEDRGASWQKRSDFVTSGNYYQEIVADPADPQTLYALDTWLHVSKDGGRSFSMVGEVTKHVDNHSMWIDPDNTSHWIVGCDGGIYQTWDAATTWAFSSNLPVTQFYKVAVDNAEPFYNIYGGTQDNFSIGGPSRTTTAHGIVNSDWFITHGGDGFETQIDPTNPDIVYAQSQYGFLVRFDKASGEEVGIQPQPGPGEAAYRWNWDAPLQISSHSPTRLYFAANKLFRSDDRGDSWTTISPDLTQQIDRNTLPVMDRIWGLDAVNKNRSTSPYGTIVAFSESPLDPNLLYVGTDDGLIQKTTDGGTTWSAIDAFPGLPERSYVNMVLASAHDANVVYACFNHHKYGDFKPYVYKSTDGGTTWTSISANLPERGSSYAIAEDHIDAKLLFVGTEFGAFFSNDSGSHWHRLKAGLPTAAVRDIAIQQREDDLVLGTFGRGFYVLDDYSPLRSLTAEFLTQEGALFPVRTALAYEASMPLGLPGKSFQGDNFYSGENLGPNALLTYYLKESIQSLKEERREREKQVENVKWPTEEALRAEEEELEPLVVLTISDANGEVVRKMEVPASKGLHRVKWDLRYASTNPIRLSKPSFYNPWGAKDIGTLVMPGMYNASLAVVRNGVATQLGQPVTFQVSALNNTTLPAPNRAEKVAFQREVSDWARQVESASRTLSALQTELKYMRKAIDLVEAPLPELMAQWAAAHKALAEIDILLNGDPVASRLDMPAIPTVSARIGQVSYEQFHSTSAPTLTHRQQLDIVKAEFPPIRQRLRDFETNELAALRRTLETLNAPYYPQGN